VSARLTRALPDVGVLAGVLATVAVAGSLLLTAAGASPGDGAKAFFEGAFGSPVDTGLTLTAAVPLVLVALGWIITWRAGRIHVGFPGQILIGGLFAGFVALEVHLPGILHLPLALLAGVVGGALYAGIAAFLWAKRGVQEIVSTLLLNLVAVQIVAWAVRGPLQESYGAQPQTDPFPLSAKWPTVDALKGATLSWDVVLVPILVIGVAFLIARTAFGFRLRLVGSNPSAARNAGYHPTRVGVAAMCLSGAFAGLAGACLLLAGETPGMTENFGGENGFNGIAVALLAFNSPFGAILAALLFAGLDVGGGAVETSLNVPSTIATVLQGLVILLVLLGATLLARRRAKEAS
jgi:simple sugar transport system permease protein